MAFQFEDSHRKQKSMYVLEDVEVFWMSLIPVALIICNQFGDSHPFPVGAAGPAGYSVPPEDRHGSHAESHTGQADRSQGYAEMSQCSQDKCNLTHYDKVTTLAPHRQNGLHWNEFLCRFLFRILTFSCSLSESSEKVVVFFWRHRIPWSTGRERRLCLTVDFSSRGWKVFLCSEEIQLTYLTLHK